MKASKQIIQDAIVREIEKGVATEKICAVICRKFQFTSRTFYNHHKKAIVQHTERQQTLKEELTKIDKEAAIEARKKAIMTASERKEYLTKIISGEITTKRPFVIGGKIMQYPEEPTHRDRISAIAELNKMEGDYSPAKVDLTSKGGPLNQNRPSIKLPDGTMLEI